MTADGQLPALGPPAPVLGDSADKRAQLRRAKRGATALLIVAVAILIGARLYPEPSYLAALIRAAAEAAIVGGLADWFAVTALFRHPLGLRIPHTALIPHRKNEIGRSLGNFVSEQFLAPELLIARLRRRNRALQVAEWLDTPEIASFLGARITGLVPMILHGADDGELRRFFATVAQDGLRRMDLRPTVDAVIDALVRRGHHMTIVDALMDLLEPIIVGLQDPLIERIGARTGRFVPAFFDRKLAKEMMQGVSAWLAEARTLGTDERAYLEHWLTDWIASFRAAPDYGDLITRTQSALVEHPALLQSLGGIWDALKVELVARSNSNGAQIPDLAMQMIRTIGQRLQDSPAVQRHLNAAIESALVSVIAPWRQGIGGYIADIVAGWDGKTVAEVIELQVGRDLQYIRVNGTLVGALIGSGLFLVGSALPWLRRAIFGN